MGQREMKRVVRAQHGLRRAAVVLGLGAAAIGVLYATNAAPSSRFQATAASDPAAGSAPPVKAAVRFGYGLTPGKAYRYTLRRHTDVLRDGEPFTGVAGEGTLEVNAIDAGPDFIDVIAQVEYRVAPLAPGAHAAPVSSTTSASAFMRLSKNGEIKALRVVPELAGTQQERLAAGVIASWLYVLPRFDDPEVISGAPTAQGPFAAKGSDPQGDFESSYSVVGDVVEPLALKMVKLDYTRASALTRINGSNHDLQWNLRDGYLLHAKAEERIGKGDPQLKIEARERTEISFVEVVASRLGASDVARYRAQSALYQLPRAASQLATVKGDEPAQSWPVLVAELRSLPADPESEKPMEVFDTLAKSLAQRPEMLPQVLAEARAQPSSSTQFKMLLGAIGNLGTPEAQHGLVELYEQTDAQGKDFVLKAQNLMNAPSTEETRAMLQRTFDGEPNEQRRRTAGLALASALQGHGADDPALAGLRQRIHTLWSSATSVNEKEYVLSMIGNSGDPAFLDILRVEVEDPTSIYRTQALDAMRFMKDEESAGLLLKGLASGQAGVQNAALDALYHHGWQPELFEPLASCFEQPNATDIRIGCARVLLNQRSAQQQMQTLLKRVYAAKDTDAELRKFIEGELSA